MLLKFTGANWSAANYPSQHSTDRQLYNLLLFKSEISNIKALEKNNFQTMKKFKMI